MGLGIGIGISPTLMTGVGVIDPIAAYFATGVNGFDFDFSKTDRLFQETTGVTAADDPNESIGLALEGSTWGGLTLSQKVAAQPELLGAPPLNGTSFPFDTFTLSGAGFSRAVKTGVAGASWDFVQTYPVGAALYYSAPVTILSGSAANKRLHMAADRSGAASFTSATRVLAAGGNTGIHVVTVASRYMEISAFGATAHDFAILGTSAKLITGNHGSQAVTNSQPKVQAGGIARADGTDDGLPTTKKMGPTGFVMVKHNTASIPAATKVLCGASGASTDYGYCGVDAAGKGVARIGTGAAMTSDDAVTGATGTLGFWWNGTTAALLVNGVKAKTQAQSGAPTTANALALFCLNNNGAPGNWIGADGYRFIHGDTAPDDATLLAFHNKLMAA